MVRMIFGYYNLKEIILFSFNTSNFENIDNMFGAYCNFKQINLPSFNI